MRIHSDTLTRFDLDAALPIRVHPIGDVALNGSRKRDHSFTIYLTGTGVHVSGHDSRYKCATYEEWGWFLAALYKLDAKMIAGPYEGLADFNDQTKGVFA